MLKNLWVIVPLLLAVGCHQNLPRSVEAKSVVGTLQSKKDRTDVDLLLYVNGEDPQKKNWGRAGMMTVTVAGADYFVQWEDAEKFKNLHEGDHITLVPSEYVVCEGKSDLNPHCQRVMKLYRGEQRVLPLSH